MAKDIEVKVKYIPDTSALKNAMNGVQNIDFKIGGNGLKKELLSPIQNAMKEVNKAMASGASNTDLLKLFKNVNTEADKVRQRINLMSTELNAGFNSVGNQQMLKQLAQYRKELERVEKESAQWTKKYGNATISKLKTNAGVKSSDQARKDKALLEAEIQAGRELTAQDQARLAALKEYVETLEERNRLQKQGITAGSFEEQRRDIVGKIDSVEKNVQTAQYNASATKELAAAQTYVGNTATYATGEINKLNASIKTEQDVANEGKKELVKFGDVVTGTFLGTSLGNLFQTGLQRGIQFFKEYDETLTRTMMVTGMTRDEVNGLTSSYNKLANQLSSTTKDVAAAQLVFYQQGLGTKEALSMTEASIAISKTGGIEASEAANRLTAAVRGYQLAASDAMDIADKMSALDAAAASSVDELTIAMQKSASQARMAGLDLDYYMAYLSTMQEVTREAPENIGTAMKSITSRMQEIRDIGKIEEDGTTFSNVAKALNSIGIAATDSAGQLRSLQDIMDELGPMWATLDRNHKAYIATTLAGNRQQSRFIALMDNYDRALELVDISQNASGESAKQLRAYNQGLEASFTALSNAWQQLATKVADSDVIKDIVDLLTDFIEILNKIPTPITQTIIPLTALIKGFKLFSNTKALLGQGKSKLFESLGLDIKDNINDLNKTLERSPELVKKFYNSFKDGSKAVRENIKAVKESGDAIETHSDTLNTNVATHESLNAEILDNTTALESNDKVKLSETTENASITTSQNKLQEATEMVNEELREQDRILGTNYTPKQQKIAANRDEITSQLSMLRNRKEVIANKQDSLKSEMRERLGKARSDYEARSDIFVRQMRAQEKLGISHQLVLGSNKDDVLDALRAETLTAKGNPKKTQAAEETRRYIKQLEDDYKKLGKEYHKTQMDIQREYFDVDNKPDQRDRYAGLLGPGNKESDDIDKQIQKLKRDRKKLQKMLEQEPEMPPIEKPETLMNTLKGISSDKNLTGIEKLGKGFGTLSESVGGFSGILSNVALGSMIAMGAETLGLDEDLSSAAGTFVGLGKTLSGFGPWGWAAAAAVAGLGFAYKKAFPSVEAVEEKLEEIRLEQDELAQKETDFKGALDVYTELSNKLDLTEEEQEQLASSTETLAKMLPEAVQGYDQYGNAIINAGQAMEYLTNLQEQQKANSIKMLDEFDELQRAQVAGWEKIGQTMLRISAITMNFVPGSQWLSPIYSGLSTAWEESINRRELEGNRKVIEENYQEIYNGLMDSVAEITDKGAEKYKAKRESISSILVNSMLATGKKYGKDVDEIKAEISSLFENFTEDTLDSVVRATEKAKRNMDFSNLTWDNVKEQLTKSLTEYFAGIDLSEEEFELMLKASLNIVYEGKVNIDEVKNKIRDAIIGSNNQDFIDAAQLLYSEIGAWDPRLQKIIQDMGLLDARFAELYETIGGMEGLKTLFTDESGMLDEETGKIKLANKLLKEIDNEKDEKESLEEDKKAKQKEIEEKKKEIAKIQEEINTKYKSLAENEESSVTGPGYYSDRVKDLEQDIWAIEKEIDGLEGEITTLDGEIKSSGDTIGKYENSWETLLATIEMGIVPTFHELSEVIKQCQEDFDALFDLAETLDSTGGIVNTDAMTQIFDLLGNFEDVAFETQEQYNAWMHAISAVNDGLYEENGVLKMNASAMQGMNDLISYSSRLKFQEMQASIEKSKIDLENQRTVLKAQSAMLETKIASIEAMSDAEFKEAQSSGDLQEELSNAYISLLDEQNIAQITGTQDKLNTLLNMEQNYYKQLALLRDAYIKGEDAGSVKFIDLDEEYDRLYEDFKKKSSAAFTDLITDDKTETVNALKNYKASIDDQITILDGRIEEEIALKETIANYLAKDSTNLAGAFSDATDEASDYNGVLERTLTLLEKIEGLQHTISENETFKSLYEGYDGEAYGRIMMSNLKLAQEQYGVYKDLFAMQQEMTNQAAGDLLDSPYGDMFKISENGDIGWADDSMYEKYKGLPGEMQEDIDGLVEAYQEQRDELRDTEQSLSVYAEAVKKAREELVEMEIEIENELVDALKNREKIMHEARTKAIDDEIKMIEEAVEARKKAREEDESEKELFQAQEALRRATLDSSGKNNAQLLQLQQDLEDKQLEISEKRFEDDMEDRKNWLQDTKDAETETYEYRLETMTWYWENVQAIQEAGQEAMMQTLIHWNEEYRTQSQLQQSEMLREWQFTMDAMKTAADMGAELGQLTIDITEVTSEVESMNISIDKLPGTWQRATDAANAYSAAARQASSYKPSTSNFVSDSKNEEKVNNSGKTEEADTSYQKYVGKEVEIKGTGTYEGYSSDMKKTTYKKSGAMFGGNENVIIQEIKKIDGKYYAYGKPLSGKNQEYHWIPVNDLQTTDFWGGEKLKKNANGGLVDYTGPTWVDGTKTHPEAFLNPYQTEKIGAMADALTDKNIMTVGGNSNVTFGSINFNVASMSSAADGKKALEIFVQGANDLMAKKGIGTKLNMNVK